MEMLSKMLSTLPVILVVVWAIWYFITHFDAIGESMNWAYPGMLGKTIMVKLATGQVVPCKILHFGKSGYSYSVRTPDGRIAYATDRNIDKSRSLHEWEWLETQDEPMPTLFGRKK